ncbi:MAG: hypothetical protein IKT46_05070 [Clostridia bacterium]|nr:hypothetical protein [Clostridia bacterium]
MNAFTRSVLWALLAAVVTAAVLIFIFAIWVYNSDDPSSLIGVLGMTAFLISCFAGGIMGARGKGSMICSITFVLIYTLICFLLCMIFGGKPGTGMLFTYLGGVACALLGSAVFGGTRIKKPKGYRRLKRRNT